MMDILRAWEWILLAYVAGGLTGGAAWAWIKKRAEKVRQ